MKMERIDNIDPDDTRRCMFLNTKCTDTMDMNDLYGTPMRLPFCNNCLMGKLIEELSRLRLTGLQP